MSETISSEADLLFELVQAEGRRKPVYPAMKSLVERLGAALGRPNLIGLGGGAPGMAPPHFLSASSAFDRMLVTAYENLETGQIYAPGEEVPKDAKLRPITKAEQLAYFKYTPAAGIKPARQAALLDTLDFCNFPASQAFAKFYFKGDPKPVTEEAVNKLWAGTLGSEKAWKKSALMKLSPFQYFLFAPSSSYAIAYTFRFMARAGCEFVLTDPTYAGYPEPILHYGGKIKWCPTDGSHWPVLKILEKTLSRGDVFVYLSPSNPTGAIYNYLLTQKIVHLVNKKDAILLGDFAYRYLIYDSGKFDEMRKSYAYICKNTRNLIGMNTLSKEASAPGTRIAYMFSNIPSFLSWYEEEAPWEYLSVNVPAQYDAMRFFGFTTLRYIGKSPNRVDYKAPKIFSAYPAYYHAKQNYIQDQLLCMYSIRRRALVKAIGHTLGLSPSVDFNVPEGALYVYANFSKVLREAYLDGSDVVEKYTKYLKSDYRNLLKDYLSDQDRFIRDSPAFRFSQDILTNVEVDVLPGSYFGASQGLCLRLNFVAERPERLDEAIRRIKNFVMRSDKGTMYSDEERRKIKWLSK